MEQTNKIQRSEVWEQIYKVVKESAMQLGLNLEEEQNK